MAELMNVNQDVKNHRELKSREMNSKMIMVVVQTMHVMCCEESFVKIRCENQHAMSMRSILWISISPNKIIEDVQNDALCQQGENS